MSTEIAEHSPPYQAAEPSVPDAPVPGLSRRFGPASRILLDILVADAIILIWILLANRLGTYILPGPLPVAQRLGAGVRSGVLPLALWITVREFGLGLAIAAGLGIPVGFAVGRFRRLERALAPYLAASQAMPGVVIFPLLAIWIGYGIGPKVVLAFLLAVFPILVSTASGVRAIEREFRDVARVFGASWWQSIAYVDAPLSVRSIFAGLKIGGPLAVVGAAVGELIQYDQGIGGLIALQQQDFDTAGVFMSVITLMAVGAGVYALMSAGERLSLKWLE
jgi:NitT/TauT family transport system permease protein